MFGLLCIYVLCLIFIFRDVFTALTDGPTVTALRDLYVSYVKKNHPNVEVVVGLDARGFLFCFAIAAELGISCVPVRKKGKLPGECYKVEYILEYGTDIFEIQRNAIKSGQRVIIVDDLLATGGSLKAASELVRKAGGEIEACIVVLELTALDGRKNLDVPVYSFIQYDD